jgi:N6-adenosine-specific RNA methylase IME4
VNVTGARLFEPLPAVEGGFQCIVSDVPARFRSNSKARPGRNAMRHYQCLPMETLATLPVRRVVARDAYLFFWTTTPLLVIGAHLPVMRAWGFEPTAMGFTWVKLNPNASPSCFSERDLFFGPGLTTRKNTECVILGKRGRPVRLAKNVFEVIVAPRREHSRKPDEAYRRIERYCARPRLDLFACERRDGWIPYGDQLDRYRAPQGPHADDSRLEFAGREEGDGDADADDGEINVWDGVDIEDEIDLENEIEIDIEDEVEA